MSISNIVSNGSETAPIIHDPLNKELEENPISQISQPVFSQFSNLYANFFSYFWKPRKNDDTSTYQAIKNLLDTMEEATPGERLTRAGTLVLSFFFTEDRQSEEEEKILAKLHCLKTILPELLSTLSTQIKKHPEESDFCRVSMIFFQEYSFYLNAMPLYDIAPPPKEAPFIPDISSIIPLAKDTQASHFAFALTTLGNLTDNNEALSQQVTQSLLPMLLNYYPQASQENQNRLLTLFINLSSGSLQAAETLSKSSIFKDFFVPKSKPHKPKEVENKSSLVLQMELLNNVLVRLKPQQKVKFLNLEWIQRLDYLTKAFRSIENSVTSPEDVLAVIANSSPQALKKVMQTKAIDNSSIESYFPKLHFRYGNLGQIQFGTRRHKLNT